MAVDTYAQCSEEVTVPLIKFLTGVDPLASVQEMQIGQKKEIINTHGKRVTEEKIISIKG